MNTPATSLGGGDTADRLALQLLEMLKHFDAIVVGATTDGTQAGTALGPVLIAAATFVQQISNGLYPDIISPEPPPGDDPPVGDDPGDGDDCGDEVVKTRSSKKKG